MLTKIDSIKSLIGSLMALAILLGDAIFDLTPYRMVVLVAALITLFALFVLNPAVIKRQASSQ